jgi:ketosteroid isomerase-like protein
MGHALQTDTEKGLLMIATETTTEATLALVTRFENGFNTRDVDALMADMTEDCVFEHVAPAAVSFGRHKGQAAVRAVWESMDTHFPGYTQEIVDVFAAGERCACRFVIRWQAADGTAGSLHGVDIITVRDGKIAEKLTYGTL